ALVTVSDTGTCPDETSGNAPGAGGGGAASASKERRWPAGHRCRLRQERGERPREELGLAQRDVAVGVELDVAGARRLARDEGADLAEARRVVRDRDDERGHAQL